MNEKERLNTNTKRYFAFRTVIQGGKNIFNSLKKAAAFIAIIIVWAVLMMFWVNSSPQYVDKLVNICTIMLTGIFVIGEFYVFGYIKHSKEYYENFVRIGFVNSASEAPVLIARRSFDGKEVLTFYSKGLTVIEWNDKKEIIQSALNRTISKITAGSDHCTVIVDTVAPSTVFETVIPWSMDYINYNDDADFILGKTISNDDVHIDIDKQPHILVGGSTGSGKTQILKVLSVQALKRAASVYICDMKGLDFLDIEAMDAQLFTTPEAILSLFTEVEQIMYDRIEEFRKAGACNFKEYISKTHNQYCKRKIIIVDECAMLLDSGISKEAKQLSAQIADKISSIARMGRCVGIHLIVGTQRPDKNAVPGSIKSNIDCRICGKADVTLSTIILGDGRANDAIPKDSQGRFIMANGAEDIIFQGFLYASKDR